MDFLQQSFHVHFQYRVHFTRDLFNPSNPVLWDTLQTDNDSDARAKILFVIDAGVAACYPQLKKAIAHYFIQREHIQLIDKMIVVDGGEAAKNDSAFFDNILAAVHEYGIDRHSYIAAVGGGAVLDLAGFAAAVSHRGIRHIRIPTTVLSQNDSGVGVKNGINYRGKKNFLGTFVPPFAVFNDVGFLTTLDDRNWRAGISEAVKVALIKDAAFFYWLEKNAAKLVQREANAMEYLIKRCAQLHLEHIGGNDPFELGSSRPLDFGHWSAHKLEQLSNFEILHGEAVAMGIALDSVYSYLSGRLSKEHADRIINLLKNLKLPVHHPLLNGEGEHDALLAGLQEFREHLGGRLTVMLLKDIGIGEEVHYLDHELIKKAATLLQETAHQK